MRERSTVNLITTFLMLILILFSDNTGKEQKFVEFQKKIELVSDFEENDHILKLKARWSNMHSSAEYTEIIVELDDMLRKEGFKIDGK